MGIDCEYSTANCRFQRSPLALLAEGMLVHHFMTDGQLVGNRFGAPLKAQVVGHLRPRPRLHGLPLPGEGSWALLWGGSVR